MSPRDLDRQPEEQPKDSSQQDNSDARVDRRSFVQWAGVVGGATAVGAATGRVGAASEATPSASPATEKVAEDAVSAGYGDMDMSSAIIPMEEMHRTPDLKR